MLGVGLRCASRVTDAVQGRTVVVGDIRVGPAEHHRSAGWRLFQFHQREVAAGAALEDRGAQDLGDARRILVRLRATPVTVRRELEERFEVLGILAATEAVIGRQEQRTRAARVGVGDQAAGADVDVTSGDPLHVCDRFLCVGNGPGNAGTRRILDTRRVEAAERICRDRLIRLDADRIYRVRTEVSDLIDTESNLGQARRVEFTEVTHLDVGGRTAHAVRPELAVIVRSTRGVRTISLACVVVDVNLGPGR